MSNFGGRKAIAHLREAGDLEVCKLDGKLGLASRAAFSE